MTFQIGIGPNVRKSAFFEATVREGVRSFSVYNHMLIPGHFGDPEGEYNRLVNGVAMWDVAAQRQVDIRGPEANALVQYLTPRNLQNTIIGQGRYIPLCDYDGWLINDPVLLKLADDHYWLSVADSDIHLWANAIAHERGLNVTVSEPDVSPLAIQGPKSIDVARALFGDCISDLKYFGFFQTQLDNIPLVVARSGWSKQGGFELYLMDQNYGDALWEIVKEAGKPYNIGPGAPNDTERLESGLISYGADMRLQTHRANPFEMGMEKLVDLENNRDFVGRDALTRIASKPIIRKRVGVVIKDAPGFPGHQLPLFQAGQKQGYICEYAFSKRLQKTIGVGLIDTRVSNRQDPLQTIIGKDSYDVFISELPFL